MKIRTIESFANTYSGKRLLQEHSLSEYGIWQVKGEDANPDFRGSHYQPTLGYFKGQLKDVIEYAVNLDRYWTWGGGGDISLVKVVELTKDSVKQMQELKAQREKLEQERKRIDNEINALGKSLK